MISSVRAVQKIFGAPPAADDRPITVLGLQPPESATIPVGRFEQRWGSLP